MSATPRNNRKARPQVPGKSLADIIPGVMKKFGMEDRLWEQTLISDWPSLVGEQVARHTRPGRLQRKILHVFVSHSTWLNELSRYGKKQMLERLQERFGKDKIKDVRLQLDPDAQG